MKDHPDIYTIEWLPIQFNEKIYLSFVWCSPLDHV